MVFFADDRVLCFNETVETKERVWCQKISSRTVRQVGLHACPSVCLIPNTSRFGVTGNLTKTAATIVCVSRFN